MQRAPPPCTVRRYGACSQATTGGAACSTTLQHRPCAASARHVKCGAGPGPGSSGGGGSGRRGGRGDKKARQPGMFEVRVVTPPPRSLGIYALPPNTHNGEEIEIEGQGYVVTCTVMQFKLVKGRYVREHSKLEVQPTGRYFVNMMLEGLIKGRYIGPTGNQD